MLKTWCRYTVTVHRRDQTMTKIVNEDSFTIGRSMDCTIPLTEDSISRVHLTVHRRQDQIWIEDKGSSNGTFVNNVRIAQNTLVNVVPTDRIRIGKSDYVVCIDLTLEEISDSSVSRLGKTDQTELLPPHIPSQMVIVDEKKHPEPDIELKEALRETPKENPNDNPKEVPKPEIKEDIQQHPRKDAFNDIFQKEFLPKTKDPAAAAVNAEREVAAFEKEKILHEAHKKGAQIIYEAELKAEKRAQAIYVAAQDRGAEADQYYQKKVQEAHKEVDRVLLTFQSQGQELIEQARQFAQEIRDEVEVFAQGARARARKEADQIIVDAQESAEALKKDAYEKARSKAEIDAEDLVTSAKAESQDILSFAKQAADEMLSKARNEMENELKDLKAHVEEKKKHIHNLKKEQEDFMIRALGEKEEIEDKISDLKTELVTLTEELESTRKELSVTRNEDADLKMKIQEQKKSSQDLEHLIGKLYSDSKSLEKKNKDLQDQTGHLKLEIHGLEDQKRLIENDVLQQKQHLKERLEKEHQVVLKEYEERLQDAQLEISKRLMKMEQEMFEEIMSRKEALVKDIIVVVETRIAKVLEPAKWDQVSSLVFEGVSETIEGKAVSFNQNSKAPKQSASLQRKKKKENFRWMGAGLTAGVLLSLLSFQGYRRVQEDKNPMRTIAAEETRKRREDLERRKFNPTQVAAIKDTYTDAVIYTSGFVAVYQDPEFQQKLYKAASAYLLKTWRVDEDISIQVLSMSSALIKELHEKRQAIHPDYVKEGIGKMRALEKESLLRMKTALGSEVRLESYRRFERKFFETEVLKKQ